MKNEDIEKIFRQDSIGKKRIGINVTKRASRRGYIRGEVRTQSDFLTAKQKRALNGEVKIVDNIYKDINKVPSWKEILEMDEEKQYKLMKTLRGLHSSNSLRLYFGIGTGTLYNKFTDLGLHQQKGEVKKMAKKGEIYKTIEDVPSFNEFLDMDRGGRINLLIQLRKDIAMNRLRKYWNISQGKLYSYLYNYGIIERGSMENGKRVYGKNEEKENIVTAIVDPVENKVENNQKINNLVEKINLLLENIESNKENIKNNFSITLNGVYTKEEVENKLLNLSGIMQEDKEYVFNLTISER